MDDFLNCYDDGTRAEAYAKLEFPATYYLAFRDLPEILRHHVKGNRALDFGCGAGRSTRFLKTQGFNAIGVDISEDMLKKAKAADPAGDYRQIKDGGLTQLEAGSFDLVLAAFSFDNIPSEQKIKLLKELGALLKTEGAIVNLVSAPEIYIHEWASFSTKDFPENRSAKSGDVVRIVVTDLEDKRPVEDIFCTDESYREIYKLASLFTVSAHRPLGSPDEPYQWISETKISPWVIYVLKRNANHSI